MRFLFLSLALSVWALTAHAFVNYENGNLHLRFIDLNHSGKSNVALVVERAYDSASSFTGYFGSRWGSNLETRLEKQSDGSLRLVEFGNGAVVPFVFSPDKGVFLSALRPGEEIRTQDARRTHTIKNVPVETFDDTGRLIEWKGMRLSYKDGVLESIDNSALRLPITTNASKRITSIGTENKECKYVYIADALTQARNSEAQMFRYDYEANGLLNFVGHPDKTTMTVKYSPRTYRVTEVKDRDGEIRSYEFTPISATRSSLLVTTSSPTKQSRKSEFSYQKIGDKTQVEKSRFEGRDGVVERVYDSEGRVLKKTIDGVTSEYKYDTQGRLREVQTGDTRIMYTYDVNKGNLQSVKIGKMQYTYSYDRDERPISISSSLTRMTLKYNAEGQVSTVTETPVKGRSTEALFHYNKSGRLEGVYMQDIGHLVFSYLDNGQRQMTPKGGNGARAMLELVALMQRYTQLMDPANLSL